MKKETKRKNKLKELMQWIIGCGIDILMKKETKLKNELKELMQWIIGGGKIDIETIVKLSEMMFELQELTRDHVVIASGQVEPDKLTSDPVVITSGQMKKETTRLKNRLEVLMQRIDDGGKIDAKTSAELIFKVYALKVIRDKSRAIPDEFSCPVSEKRMKDNVVISSHKVPDYVCCKITLDILGDPVISPSGVTYERATILEHLQKVGKFDPVTRESLKESQLIPNLAIKEAVQDFQEKHGWVYEMD